MGYQLSDGSERSLVYASRSLSEMEQRYAHIDKETLSIIFAVKRFHQYLFGLSFTIITDHKPLLGLFGSYKVIPAMSSSRMQRWALMLSAYDYTIEPRSGIKNSNADALSRLPMQNTVDESEIFTTHGFARSIGSDNGSCFTSEEYSKFVKQNGIQHIRTDPYHPASNGLAERVVQIIKNYIKQMMGDNMQNKITRFHRRGTICIVDEQSS